MEEVKSRDDNPDEMDGKPEMMINNKRKKKKKPHASFYDNNNY